MSVNLKEVSNSALFEKVMLQNDFAGLTSLEKVTHIKNICESLGLNPLTKPIQLIKFQGKEIAYFSKDATEQLRKINKISIISIDTKILDGGVYIVTVNATTPDGRTDASTAALSIQGLKGEALANAMMKCETKAKRRVTLSISGLGFIDEMEAESIPGAKKFPPVITSNVKQIEPAIIEPENDLGLLTVEFMHDIVNADSIRSLKAVFDEIKNINFKSNPELLKKLVEAKDAKKHDLEQENAKAEDKMIAELNSVDVEAVNTDTGEIIS